MIYVTFLQLAAWAGKLSYGLSTFHNGGVNRYCSIMPRVLSFISADLFFISFYLDGRVVVSSEPTSDYFLCVKCEHISNTLRVGYYEVHKS